MTRVASIHQPNFFPWLGYFNKLARSDVFVILDDVQYQKTGSSWSNRVKLLVGGEARWVTAPVRRPGHGTARVNELLWGDGPWREKLVRTVRLNYAGAEYFREATALVEPLILNARPDLAGYNIHVITTLRAALGLQAEVVLASKYGVRSTANERLIELVKLVDCDTYLAGGGAGGYQEDRRFADAGVQVLYQSFVQPSYPQSGTTESITGLSIIDSLMNCGIAGTRRLLEH